MPAPRFFCMLEAARKLRNRKLVWECYTARSASLTQESFESTIQFFDKMGEIEEAPDPIEVPGISDSKPADTQKQDPLKGDQLKYAVMGAFALDRRINREVH